LGDLAHCPSNPTTTAPLTMKVPDTPVTAMNNLAPAGQKLPIETVESHLHPEGSFDLADHPVPTGLEEIWRFTPLKRLRGLHRDAPLDGTDFTVDVTAADGVSAESVDASDSSRGTSRLVPTDRVSARAWAASSRLFKVSIPRETVTQTPTFVTLHGQGVEHAAAGHVIIEAQPFSKSTVVITYDGSATFVDNVEIVVGDGAQLTLVSVQDWNDDSVHQSSQHARVGRDATFRHVAVTFGGDVVRMDLTAEYDGPGGYIEMLGLYFADAGQHLEHRLFVDHTAPKTKSRVTYKGALQGAGAHTVWIGNVLIRKVAEGIDTYEENRNLVLTDGCRADSVPNLEIETGEIVGAGHAAATGRFDDEQLFYLRSRGISEEEARRLVVHGFFAETIKRIGVPELEPRLLAAVERELEEYVGADPVARLASTGTDR
jgi:Fe-S cluster assembly protein SufD